MRRLHKAGFTLVELLVAISLLALTAVLTWRALDQVLAQRDRVDARTTESEHVLVTLAQLERDMASRVPNQLFVGRRQSAGLLPLALQIGTVREGEDSLRILRIQSGAAARAVTYTVEDGTLVRTLARVQGEDDDTTVTLLRGVSRFSVQVFLGGRWLNPVDAARALNAGTGTAIQIAIEITSGARYVQVLGL
jgi:general secretion pathway protein J